MVKYDVRMVFELEVSVDADDVDQAETLARQEIRKLVSVDGLPSPVEVQIKNYEFFEEQKRRAKAEAGERSGRSS